MATLGDIQLRGDPKDVKQVMNYVYQMEEQVRYALKHLDSGNIQSGSIGAEQLSGAVQAQLKAAGSGSAKSALRVKNDALRIDQDGYRQTAGTFRAMADADSFLQMGEDLRLDGGGRIQAGMVELPDGLAPAMEISDEIGEEAQEYRIYVGTEQPEGHGILWIIPAAATANDGGVSACQVKYVR